MLQQALYNRDCTNRYRRLSTWSAVRGGLSFTQASAHTPDANEFFIRDTGNWTSYSVHWLCEFSFILPWLWILLDGVSYLQEEY